MSCPTKTLPSGVDRRRFLRHTWSGVAGGVSLALLRGDRFFAGLSFGDNPIQPNWFWNDAWDGYPSARQRLLRSVVESGVRNPVFVTGDWHSTFVNDLKLDFADPMPRRLRPNS